MQTIVLVLLEVLVVIGCSRLIGIICSWLRQPLVIGEILAGILLGPSLLGWVAPDLSAFLFPAEAVPFLNILSQVGLIFFMFLIGLELNPTYLQGQLRIAVLTSHASILLPFSLGTLLALLLYPLVSTANVSFTAFALFLGAAMSITAFPVLARIITENNLQSTRLGTLALTCAAVDDVTAWCLLALAIAVTRTNSMVGAIPTLIEAVLYTALMLTVGRQFLKRLADHYDRAGRLNQSILALIYMGVVASALMTEWIGIHLIFGAFLLGAVMPRHPDLCRELAQKTEDFVLIFLLPVFFAYSGLKTQIGLLNSPELWGLCGLVLAVAIIGKYLGSYAAARYCGISDREASALGWLMNTRGLTELIVLNIGLSLKVISPLLFTMLVMMALTTTIITSPVLEWVYPKRLIQLQAIAEVRHQEMGLEGSVGLHPDSSEILPPTIPSPIAPDILVQELALPDTSEVYRILVPMANPYTQERLLKLAVDLAGLDHPAVVHPLSLIEIAQDYAFESTPLEVEHSLQQRRERLEELIQNLTEPGLHDRIHPIIRTTSDVARDTAQMAELDRANLVLLGWHRPAFSSNRLGGRVGQILELAKVDVAVFVDQGHDKFNQLLVPYAAHIHDDLALELALRFLLNQPSRRLTVLRMAPSQGPDFSPLARVRLSDDRELEQGFSYELRQVIQQLPLSVRDRILVQQVATTDPIQAVVEASALVDLTIAGASREWGVERQTLGRYTDELSNSCLSALLITRKYSQVTSQLGRLLPKLNPPPDNNSIEV